MEHLSVFSPLFAFLFTFLFGRWLGDRTVNFITSAAVILASFASTSLFFDVLLGGKEAYTLHIAEWINSGSLEADWALRIDSLSVIMMCVINIVSACVHVYSIGYMSHDPGRKRFMSYLSLFTFAMLMLVTADNLVQLFFGWEGVGLASYLLIGFWNKKRTANVAAMKAFIMNRVGDLGLILGIFTLFILTGSVRFDVIFASAPALMEESLDFFGFAVPALTLACLLLFMGAIGKSAQLGLHTWLPDAMEGPTPVSALIHAATMVTAGVFLIARFSPVFEYAPDALMVVTIIGALTAILAATIGMTQFDIKRVIAYSTMSQLGYMFFALGVSAYPAAIFHLVTHAFFKALLFLGAGSVIHALSDEQDMRNMGGLWRKIPVTYGFMWIGSLALAGIPLFSGYYSKDMILEAAYSADSWQGLFAFWVGILAALLTAFYSWRLILMTFHGKPRMKPAVLHHAHESPPVMILPLIVLAAGAIFSGALLYKPLVGGISHEANHEDVSGNTWAEHPVWGNAIYVLAENDTVTAAHHVPDWVVFLPVIIAVAGICLACLSYLVFTGLPCWMARSFAPVHRLFFYRWYFDELYDRIFVKTAKSGGKILYESGDKGLIDRFGPNGLAYLSRAIGQMFSRMQTGFVYNYAFIMIIGLMFLLGWIILRGQV